MLPIQWPEPESVRPLHGGWTLTTEHAWSSYGDPVLVDPRSGIGYGPGDLLDATQVAELRGVSPHTLGAYLSRGLSSAGPGWVRTGRRGWVMTAADAVRQAD